MLLIQLPEGTYLVLDHIVSVGPRFEFEALQEGASIHCTNGEVYTTGSSVDEVLDQIREAIQQIVDSE